MSRENESEIEEDGPPRERRERERRIERKLEARRWRVERSRAAPMLFSQSLSGFSVRERTAAHQQRVPRGKVRENYNLAFHPPGTRAARELSTRHAVGTATRNANIDIAKFMRRGKISIYACAELLR